MVSKQILIISSAVGITVTLVLIVLYAYYLRKGKVKMEPKIVRSSSKLSQTSALTHRITATQTSHIQQESKLIQTPKSQPLQIHIVQTLERNSTDNTQFAEEFLRGARTIENFLQNHNDEEKNKHLSSFLINDIPHLVRRLVDDKQKIRNILVTSTEFDEDIVHELSEKMKKFEYDSRHDFEYGHTKAMEQIKGEYNDEYNEEYTDEYNLRILYENYVFLYYDRDKLLIENAMQMQKENDRQSEMEHSEFETESDASVVEAQTPTQTTDEYGESIIRNQKEEEREELSPKWKRKDYFIYVGLPISVVIFITVLALFMVGWIMMHKLVVFGGVLLIFLVFGVLYYYCVVGKRSKELEKSENDPFEDIL